MHKKYWVISSPQSIMVSIGGVQFGIPFVYLPANYELWSNDGVEYLIDNTESVEPHALVQIVYNEIGSTALQLQSSVDFVGARPDPRR